VVDNGSRDATAARAAEAGATVVLEPRRGYGSACLAGIARLPADCGVVLFLDADHSDHAEEAGAVVGPILRGEADLVIGSRMLGVAEPGALLPQARWGNRLACLLMRLLFPRSGRPFTDLGPFRAISKAALDRIGMVDTNFGWTVEMQVKALQHRLRCIEVPVSYRRRTGVSKITGTVSGTIRAGSKILWTIFRYAFLERFRDSLLLAIAWRYATHAAMVAIALWHEGRPSASPPDSVLAAVPKIDWIACNNYWIWLAFWVPITLWLLVRDRPAGLRFLWLGGWLSLVRGLTIPLTGLGPVGAPDLNAGASAATLFDAWISIVNPFTALTTDAPHLCLTKDLFFSGHVATTFLLWLYCRPHPRLGPAALAAHLAMVAIVLLSHLHYAIDVVGAWAITFSLFALREGWRGVSAQAPAAPR